MKLIGTHNSATGEKPGSFISRLFSVFSKCQDLTIREQSESGVTHFDIRVKKLSSGRWVCAHGLWRSEDTVGEILSRIDRIAYVGIAYEGALSDPAEFLEKVSEWGLEFPLLRITNISVKKPVWKDLKAIFKVPRVKAFAEFTGWKMLIPIPRFWAWISNKKLKFSNDYWTIIDFYERKYN